MLRRGAARRAGRLRAYILRGGLLVEFDTIKAEQVKLGVGIC
jgi:hypothetical protein